MTEPARRVARHHTKDKGDLGVACVIADLMKADIQVALPISEHLPYDLVAISAQGAVAKVQVKFLSMRPNGTLDFRGLSCWTDRHGTHHRAHREGAYDAVAVYCPDTDSCYYVPAAELTRQRTTLRILETRNRQKVGVRMVDDFADPQRMFVGPRSSAG